MLKIKQQIADIDHQCLGIRRFLLGSGREWSRRWRARGLYMARPAQLDQLLRRVKQPGVELQSSQIFGDRLVATSLLLEQVRELNMGVRVVVGEIERPAIGGLGLRRPAAFS